MEPVPRAMNVTACPAGRSVPVPTSRSIEHESIYSVHDICDINEIKKKLPVSWPRSSRDAGTSLIYINPMICGEITDYDFSNKLLTKTIFKSSLNKQACRKRYVYIPTVQ
jgi:hypothetical protein